MWFLVTTVGRFIITLLIIKSILNSQLGEHAEWCKHTNFEVGVTENLPKQIFEVTENLPKEIFEVTENLP